MTHAELTAADIHVSEEAYARLARFVALLAAENQRLNLTAIRAPQEVWDAHICDSLTLLPLIRELRPARLLDLGTGGGIPGIPLACACPEIEVTLLDATRKKVEAVGRMAEALQLANVRALWGRAETLAHDPAQRETFDAVTARAVAPLSELIEYAAGFARVGGRCWFFKTQPAMAREGCLAEGAEQACGLAYVNTRHYELPRHGARVLAIYEKWAALRADLPRPPGRAAKKPL